MPLIQKRLHVLKRAVYRLIVVDVKSENRIHRIGGLFEKRRQTVEVIVAWGRLTLIGRDFCGGLRRLGLVDRLESLEEFMK